MMMQVVSPEGTGEKAGVKYYSVAGKTGTAAKPREGGIGYTKTYMATFVGFAPAERPFFESRKALHTLESAILAYLFGRLPTCISTRGATAMAIPVSTRRWVRGLTTSSFFRLTPKPVIPASFSPISPPRMRTTRRGDS